MSLKIESRPLTKQECRRLALEGGCAGCGGPAGIVLIIIAVVLFWLSPTSTDVERFIARVQLSIATFLFAIGLALLGFGTWGWLRSRIWPSSVPVLMGEEWGVDADAAWFWGDHLDEDAAQAVMFRVEPERFVLVVVHRFNRNEKSADAGPLIREDGSVPQHLTLVTYKGWGDHLIISGVSGTLRSRGELTLPTYIHTPPAGCYDVKREDLPTSVWASVSTP